LHKDTQILYKLGFSVTGNERTIYTLRIILNSARQFGFDPIVLLNAIKTLPRFLKQAVIFRALNRRANVRLAPALQDYKASAGSSDGHYFWQDLLCAQWINEAKPKRHFDVGSRIDGFIAHLLSFREVTLLDIRTNNLNIPGLTVVTGDAQETLTEYQNSFDSVSSLHSIEHFGLGRYGDKLDAQGHKKGLKHIAECVQLGGLLYVSFPIGKEEVEFNSQRILSPMWPIAELSDFELQKFVLIPWRGQPITDTNPQSVDLSIKGQAGLYKFLRIR
jgi:hypothetical protein